MHCAITFPPKRLDRILLCVPAPLKNRAQTLKRFPSLCPSLSHKIFDTIYVFTGLIRLIIKVFYPVLTKRGSKAAVMVLCI